jgi:hypothetical protein
MNRKRVDEYHKHGCDFHGKLVIYDYMEDMKNDPQGNFNAGVSIDYMIEAKKDAESRYNIKRVLLSIPELVIEI